MPIIDECGQPCIALMSYIEATGASELRCFATSNTTGSGAAPGSASSASPATTETTPAPLAEHGAESPLSGLQGRPGPDEGPSGGSC